MKKLRCVMLIDDDHTTNFLNELLISELGITDHIMIALNGQDALYQLKEVFSKNDYCPDLILLDINMPVMDGFHFLEEFNGLTLVEKRSTIVVMVTTSLNPGDIAKAEEFNVKGYINKPLLEAELKSVVEKYFH